MVKEMDRPRRWAEFRFSVIGGLLSSPPEPGELKTIIKELSERSWRHPIGQQPYQISVPTIERWYYKAKRSKSPVTTLQRGTRSDIGNRPSLSPEVRQYLSDQYLQHRSWRYQLHADNLLAKFPNDCPSYDSVRRFMKSTGLIPQPRRRNPTRPGQQATDRHFDQREVRSYEVRYAGGLWHLDFHTASRQIVTSKGKWLSPQICAVLDDHTRLCCHAQWYLTETTEDLVHCFVQALLKRGLPRALMTDNGSAMTAQEFTTGLLQLSIGHETTLTYAPWQNGKQECFWGKIEGRLLAMLDGVKDLDLKTLNDATIAWVEREYNHEIHSETGQTPYERMKAAESVLRESPSTETLKQAFMMEVPRRQRRSDGTISLEGRRYEIPSRYQTMDQIEIAYARWDLSSVLMIDKRNRKVLVRLYPVDKVKNSDGFRRTKTPIAVESSEAQPRGEIAPLLRKYLEDYAATGLPAAYIQKAEVPDAT